MPRQSIVAVFFDVVLACEMLFVYLLLASLTPARAMMVITSLIINAPFQLHVFLHMFLVASFSLWAIAITRPSVRSHCMTHVCCTCIVIVFHHRFPKPFNAIEVSRECH